MDKDIKKGLNDLKKPAAKFAKAATVGVLEVTASALGVMAGATEKAVDTVADGWDKAYEKTIKDLMSKHPENNHLWMSEIVDHTAKGDKSVYDFRDMSGHTICFGKSSFDHKLQHIVLYDDKNQKLGEIKEKRIFAHNPLDPYPLCFNVTIYGKNCGEIKKISGYKNNLYMTSTGWKLVHIRHGFLAIVDKSNKRICDIKSASLLSPGDFIDYEGYEQGIQMLLLILANKARKKIKERRIWKNGYDSYDY